MSPTTRAVLIGIAVALALVLLLVPLLTMAMMMGMGGMMGPGGMGGVMGPGGIGGMMGQPGTMMWPGWLMLLSWGLVAVGIILLLVWGVRRLEIRGSGANDEAPLAILQRRYASGEIGPEEYERIHSDLMRDGPAGE
jgi:uncharacterized membrane protein